MTPEQTSAGYRGSRVLSRARLLGHFDRTPSNRANLSGRADRPVEGMSVARRRPHTLAGVTSTPFASPNPEPPAERERCRECDRGMDWVRVQLGYLWQCWTCGRIRFPRAPEQ